MSEFCNNLLARARLLITMAKGPDGSRRHVVEDGYVLTNGDIIEEAGAWSSEVLARLTPRLRTRKITVLGGGIGYEPQQIDGILMPGFVKAHGHDHEQMLKGRAKGVPLTAWLDSAVNPLGWFLRDNTERLDHMLEMDPFVLAYAMARLEDVRFGITTALTHHCNHNKLRIRELRDANHLAGTCLICVPGAQDRFYDPRVLDTPEEAIARLDAATELESDYFQIAAGADQCFSNSRAMLEPIKRWARDQGKLFHIHSAEEPGTTRWFTESIEPGMTPVEYFESIGILDRNTMLAHQVNCGEKDINILARRNVAVVHNPLANTILGSGMPPVIEMRDQGVRVAVSTDGSGSADNQSMIGAMKAMLQYFAAYHRNNTLLTAWDALEMATVVPAQMMHIHAGELAPGRLADFIIVDTSSDQLHLQPTESHNAAENLVWAATGTEISTVVCHGRLLRENGRFMFVDIPTMVAKLRMLSREFDKYLATATALKATGVHGQ